MRLLSVLVLLLATLPISAQEKKGEKRTCRILYLRAPSGAPTKLQLFDGKTSQEVDLPRMNFSKPYILPPGPLNLRMLTQPVLLPEELPAGAPTAVVPADMRDCYLLVSADPGNAVAPVRLQVVDAGTSKFRTGQILWFNLSPHHVGGTVGSEKLKLKPQSRTVMNSPANKRERYPVDLAFVVNGDKRLHPLCETAWLHDPRSRMVAFVFNEKGRRTPRVLAFSDFRPPPEKDES